MKKMYMRTIIGSSGGDCVLMILFQLNDSKAGPFKVIYSGWIKMTCPNLHTGRRTNLILIQLNTILQQPI